MRQPYERRPHPFWPPTGDLGGKEFLYALLFMAPLAYIVLSYFYGV